MAESTASLREEMLALSGIDIMLDKNTFKSTYQIVDELSRKWEDLSDIAQATIIELVAGKHQGNVFASLMSNFDTARAALDTSLTSSGSAMAEHAKWSESLEARLNKLKAAWQSLSQTFMKTDFLKVIIDVVIKFIETLDGIIDKTGVILPLLVGFAGKNALGKIFDAKKTTQFAGGLTTVGDAVTILINSFSTLKNAVSVFYAALAGGATKSAAFKAGFASFISGNWITLAIAAIGIGVTLFSKYTESAEELAERIEEVTTKYKEQHAELSKLKGDYDTSNEDSMISRYGELSKGVNEFGENLALTTDEYSEYLSIVEQIASTNPELVTGYNSQGNAILECKGDVDALTESYRNLIKEQNKELLTGKDEDGNYKKNFENAKDILKDFRNDLGDTYAYYTTDEIAEDGATVTVEHYSTKYLDTLQNLMKFNGDKLNEEISKLSIEEQNQIANLLEAGGIKRDSTFNDVANNGRWNIETTSNYIQRALSNYVDESKSALDNARKDLSAYAEDLGTVTSAYFNQAFLGGDTDSEIGNYSEISERMQSIIGQTVSNLDADFYSDILNITDKDAQWKALQERYNSILKAFASMEEDGSSAKLEAAFDLKTRFNGGEIPYGEYVKGVQEAGDMVDRLGLHDEVEKQIKLSLGLADTDGNGNGNWSIEDYETLLNRLTSDKFEIQLDTDTAKSWIDNLTSTELNVTMGFVESKDADFNSALQNYRNVLDEAEQAGVNFSKTVFGNVDTKARQVLEWNSENLEKYKNEIMSWAGSNVTWGNIRKQYENTISTVDASLSSYEINGKEVDFAITPMLQTDNGAKYLSSSVVDTYINELIAKAIEDGKWDNAELISLDASGIEIEGQKIKGLIADIGETAEATSRQMHFVGKDGALALAESEIFAMVEEQAKINEALNFKIDIAAEREGIEVLNTAITESVSACGLSVEALDSLQARYSKLDSYDAAKLFERTAHGIHINRDEFNKLEKEIADSNIKKIDDSLKTVTEAYEDTTEKIRTCSDATERNALIADQVTYANKIRELSELQAQYDGLTSSYNNWVNAQEAGEEGDIYDDVMEKLEAAKELRKQGLVGTNEFAAAVGFMSGKDTTTMSVDEIVSAYEEATPKMKRYFTEGSKGVQNLLNDLNSINENWASVDESGAWKISVPIEDAAKELGISVDALEAVLGKGTDYGLTINYDSVYKAAESLETLYTKAESANDKLRELGHTDLTFSFESTNEKDLAVQIEKAQKIVDEIKNADLSDDGKINLSVEGAEEAQLVLETLMLQKQEVAKPEIMNVSLAMIGDEKLGDVIKAMQEIQTYKNLYEIQVAIGADTSETETKIQDVISRINTLKNENPQVFADLNLDTDEFNNALSTITGNISANATLDPAALETVQSTISGIDATVLASVGIGDTTELQGIDGTADIEPILTKTVFDKPLTGTADITPILTTTDVGTLTGKASITPSLTKTTLTVDIVTNTVSEANGTANVNGTAFANGTTGRAFKRGSWGIKGYGTALGGELGMETLVRDGHFYTIGDNGAEFFKYKQGDIIFNHKQTEELFKNGKVTSGGGRGKMFANGSAFADGNAFAGGIGVGGGHLYVLVNDGGKPVKKKIEPDDTADGDGTVYSSSKSSSGGGGSSSKDKEEFEETVDWIETAIDRIKRAIDKLDKKTNNVYKSWSDRNSALTDQIVKVGDEINLQQQAYDRYLKQANNVGLSEAYASKVRDGTIDIETIKDEELKKKIDDYKNWYDKALACQDAIEDLRISESELYAQRFEYIQAQYDGILQGYEHTEAMLNEYISQAEENGHIVSKKYYQSLIDNEKDNIDELRKEQSDLIAERDKAVADGKIVKGSEAWLEQCAAIDEVTQAIEESTTSLLEYDNAMRDIDWQIFDLIQERISGVAEEADFLIELMSNKKLFDDDGKLTSQGIATMALHAQSYNTNMYQADEYGAEVAKLNAQIAEDPYDQNLINRRNELIELQREAILNAEQEKESIKDLVEEGISLELDALQERIDKYNESIDAAKDLYDYQKNVQKQSEEIASLEKQRAAYLGNDSEEAKAKLQEIEVSLKDAKEGLQETEYERYISGQQELLDTLYGEYELILNQRIDNIDYLLEQVIESINTVAGSDGDIVSALGSEGAIAIAVSNNAESVKDTLTSETNKVGITLSNAMNSIWSTGDGNAKSVLTMYGEDFKTKSTTIITTLNSIKTGVNNMVSSLNKEATSKTTANKTSTSAKKDPTKPDATSKSTTATKKSSGGDGTPKVGDKVKFVSGQYYYDSQGTKPLGSNNQGKEVYITNINTKSWATHPYHISTGSKLGSGDLGWLKLNQISGYATGKYNFTKDEDAWTQEDRKREFIVRPSDGAILTPIAKRDSVLNSAASKNIWDMANSPAEFIKNNLGISTASVPNNSTVQNSYTQYLDKVVFNLPNVHNYEEFLSAMKKDRNFERLVQSMTIDQIAGKSSLGKGKSIR